MLKRCITHRSQDYQVILVKEDNGGYSATVPGVPGAYSDGDTEVEVLENIADAIAMLEECEAEVAEILRVEGVGGGQEVTTAAPASESQTD